MPGHSSVSIRPQSYSVDCLSVFTERQQQTNLRLKTPLLNEAVSKPPKEYITPKPLHEVLAFFQTTSEFLNQKQKKIFCLWNMYKAKLLTKIRYLKLVPGFLLIVAVIVASSNLWLNDSQYSTLLAGGGIVLVSFIVLYLEYFHSQFDGFCSTISHFWWGLLFGTLAFGSTIYRLWQYDDRDRLMDLLLMTSTALKCCCDFLDRFCEDIPYMSTFLLRTELGFLLGFVGGGVVFLGPQSDLDLFLIVIASMFVVINLRMKCTLAFLYLFLFIAVSGIAVFDNLEQVINRYAVVCFYARLFFPAAADFYFSPLSAIERWSCSLLLSGCKQLCLVFTFFVVEVLFSSLAFYVIFLHPEYELVFVIPVVTVSGLLWLCTHLAYLSTEVVLSRKLSECLDFYNKLPTTSGGTNLSHIMSNKGVRLLCLVGQQTVACALIATFIFGAVCWRRENAAYPAILLVVIGLECCSFGRIRELAVKLGGTCVAYGLITPTTVSNPNASVTILPADSIQQQNERATSLISSMHRFFALYLLDSLGCDYSTSGVSLSSVEEKIKSLFLKRTKEGSGDGVRFDTYLLYYSGLTTEDGSLVLGDGTSLSPDQVLNLWRESCFDDQNVTSSRLLMILDIPTPEPWLKAVRSLKREYVALQSCVRFSSKSHKCDVETGLAAASLMPGSFTPKWVQWNYEVTNGLAARLWFEEDRDVDQLRPAYAVSRRWTDFALRIPTTNDGKLSKHWKTYYSLFCRPCLTVSATCARRLQLVRLLGAPGRRYRRLKMRWFPPVVMDTGHGFKLIRH